MSANAVKDEQSVQDVAHNLSALAEVLRSGLGTSGLALNLDDSLVLTEELQTLTELVRHYCVLDVCGWLLFGLSLLHRVFSWVPIRH